ncbi:MAG: dienelactone hydrolase family protein [Polyangiaceae bacterium]|nr:dienelactone hydrolase family protein [Polyangiaceae bacterium]
MSRESTRQGVQYREHSIEGLRVLEVVVGRVDFEARLPMVMQIHGRGDRARVPEGSLDPGGRPMRILVPEAPRPAGLGFTWSPVSVTANRPTVLGAALVREADRLARVLRHVESMRDVQGRPIVTGFSQGAMLTYTLAVRHPEAIGAALPISGWIPPHIVPRARPQGDQRVSILALHGTGDPIVRVGPTRVAVRRLRHLGYDVHLEEIPGAAHEVVPEMRRRHRELLRSVLRRVIGRDGPSA